MSDNPEILRYRRKLCRHVAASLIEAMSVTDSSFEDMDTRLAVTPGASKRAMMRLVNGTDADLCWISDLAFAMDCEVRMSLRQDIPIPAPPIEEPTP